MINPKKLIGIIKLKLLENYNFNKLYKKILNNEKIYYLFFLRYLLRKILIKVTFSSQNNVHAIFYGFNKDGIESTLSSLLENLELQNVSQIKIINNKEIKTHINRGKGNIIFSDSPLNFFESKFNVFNAPLDWKVFIFIAENDPRELINLKNKKFGDINYISPDYSYQSSHNYPFSGFGIIKVMSISRFLKKFFKKEIITYRNVMTSFCLNDEDQLPFKSFKRFCNKLLEKTCIDRIYDRNISSKNKNDSYKNWFENDEYINHTVKILRIFPEIEELSIELGYQKLNDLVAKKRLIKIIKNNPIKYGYIVAFYTENEPYQSEAKKFIKAIQKLGLKLKLKKYKPNKIWEENCAIKSSFLKEIREQLKGPLLYVDIDAIIHHDPWIYLNKYISDIAVFIDEKGNLVSGTIFINDTKGARILLNNWVEFQKNNPLMWDQIALLKVIQINDNKKIKSFNSDRLPVNLIKIFDENPKYFHGYNYIEHFQISREVKKDIYLKTKKGRMSLKRRYKYKKTNT